ncbi:universal stress protein [Streptomyces olivoreticuli]
MRTPAQDTEGLVVGTDGSSSSLAALRWSAAMGRRLHTKVDVVHAWTPTARHCVHYALIANRPTAGEERRRAGRLLDASVAWLLEHEPEADIRSVLAEGPAVPVLLRCVERAELLVLGRGPRREPGLSALGPVARECARRARCPVVTVPCVVAAPHPAEDGGAHRDIPTTTPT